MNFNFLQSAPIGGVGVWDITKISGRHSIGSYGSGATIETNQLDLIPVKAKIIQLQFHGILLNKNVERLSELHILFSYDPNFQFGIGRLDLTTTLSKERSENNCMIMTPWDITDRKIYLDIVANIIHAEAGHLGMTAIGYWE